MADNQSLTFTVSMRVEDDEHHNVYCQRGDIAERPSDIAAELISCLLACEDTMPPTFGPMVILAEAVNELANLRPEVVNHPHNAALLDSVKRYLSRIAAERMGG